jgi:N-acetylmuramoyl-L-alanine amidase
VRVINKIIIHCSATKPSQDIDAETIRRWHVEDNKWSDIGYHYVITREGDIQEGRDVSRSGAHARDFNANSIGVCLVGGINENGETDFNFTHEQMTSLKVIVDQCVLIHGPCSVLGHRDLPGVDKDCPGFDVRAWWGDRS